MKTSSFADPSQLSNRAVSRRLLGRFTAIALAIIALLTSATLVYALDGAPVPPKVIVETSANIPGIGIVVKGRPGNRVVGNTTTGADGTFAVTGLAPITSMSPPAMNRSNVVHRAQCVDVTGAF